MHRSDNTKVAPRRRRRRRRRRRTTTTTPTPTITRSGLRHRQKYKIRFVDNTDARNWVKFGHPVTSIFVKKSLKKNFVLRNCGGKTCFLTLPKNLNLREIWKKLSKCGGFQGGNSWGRQRAGQKI